MDQNYPTPFNQSSLPGRELEHISKTMTIGRITRSQSCSKKCHAFGEQVLGVQKQWEICPHS
jgi:hypothetical protein